MLSIRVKCKECKEKFDVNGTVIKEDSIKVIEDDKGLLITFYECPKCNKRYVVQLDDNETLTILKNIEESSKKLRSKIKNSRELQKFSKLREDLKQTRNALNIQYKGKHFMKDMQIAEIVITFGA